MLTLHADILKKNGRNEFVVLPYEEFVQLQALLEDARDVLALREAKAAEADAPTLTLETLKIELGLDDAAA